jgi:hypothetical protein
MRQGNQGPSSLSAIRVISTPIPPRRLYDDLAVQLRAMLDDVLSEPVPGELLALVSTSKQAVPSEEGSVSTSEQAVPSEEGLVSTSEQAVPSEVEMSDGAATVPSGVDRRR